ncbi:hypothetical protein PAXINDRAFT_171761 [Paxillus involutus ATCC 200175]|uniref:Uncharacterized protein n=1 Tax=Paxillus involutus ATCC 200175 TaxID=664439 RepID=A0A0C9TLI8_PAXIN|nr:hypothetical protein PAXINDRAFT_171761 [Paxillus involutus ATCC 200175]
MPIPLKTNPKFLWGVAGSIFTHDQVNPTSARPPPAGSSVCASSTTGMSTRKLWPLGQSHADDGSVRAKL